MSKLNLFKFRIVHPVETEIYSCLSYNCDGEFCNAMQPAVVEHLISILFEPKATCFGFMVSATCMKLIFRPKKQTNIRTLHFS